VAANPGLWSAAVISQIALAPLAGALVAAVGVAPAFLVNAASFAASTLLLVGASAARPAAGHRGGLLVDPDWRGDAAAGRRSVAAAAGAGAAPSGAVGRGDQRPAGRAGRPPAPGRARWVRVAAGRHRWRCGAWSAAAGPAGQQPAPASMGVRTAGAARPGGPGHVLAPSHSRPSLPEADARICRRGYPRLGANRSVGLPDTAPASCGHDRSRSRRQAGPPPHTVSPRGPGTPRVGR
jgi:hypothetical protein